MLVVWQVFVTIVRTCFRAPFEKLHAPHIPILVWMYVFDWIICKCLGRQWIGGLTAIYLLQQSTKLQRQAHTFSSENDRIGGAAEKLLLTLSLVRLNLRRLFIRWSKWEKEIYGEHGARSMVNGLRFLVEGKTLAAVLKVICGSSGNIGWLNF